MDIRTLQYFLAVAREESISGAAEFLHMTQPPLSRQLKELEAELGKQLFIRGNRKNNADGRWYDPAQKSRRNRCSNGKKPKLKSTPLLKTLQVIFILAVQKLKVCGCWLK